MACVRGIHASQLPCALCRWNCKGPELAARRTAVHRMDTCYHKVLSGSSGRQHAESWYKGSHKAGFNPERVPVPPHNMQHSTQQVACSVSGGCRAMLSGGKLDAWRWMGAAYPSTWRIPGLRSPTLRVPPGPYSSSTLIAQPSTLDFDPPPRPTQAQCSAPAHVQEVALGGIDLAFLQAHACSSQRASQKLLNVLIHLHEQSSADGSCALASCAQ